MVFVLREFDVSERIDGGSPADGTSAIAKAFETKLGQRMCLIVLNGHHQPEVCFRSRLCFKY